MSKIERGNDAWTSSARSVYSNLDRRGKSALLDQICKYRSVHRKHAIRLLSQRQRMPSPAQRKSRAAKVLATQILDKIWERSGCLSVRRLHAAMDSWVRSYESNFGALQPEVKQLLLRSSCATIHRRISGKRKVPENPLRVTVQDIFSTIRNSQMGILRPQTSGFVFISELDLSVGTNSRKYLIALDYHSAWLSIVDMGAGILNAMSTLEAAVPFPINSATVCSSSIDTILKARQYFWNRSDQIYFASSLEPTTKIDLPDSLSIPAFIRLHNFGLPIIFSEHEIMTPYDRLKKLHPGSSLLKNLSSEEALLFDEA
jgi:hypothetical protein